MGKKITVFEDEKGNVELHRDVTASLGILYGLVEFLRKDRRKNLIRADPYHTMAGTAYVYVENVRPDFIKTGRRRLRQAPHSCLAGFLAQPYINLFGEAATARSRSLTMGLDFPGA